MISAEAKLQTLENELSNLFMRIDFREEKYHEHCEEWKASEQGVLYLEGTVKLQILASAVKSNINKIKCAS